MVTTKGVLYNTSDEYTIQRAFIACIEWVSQKISRRPLSSVTVNQSMIYYSNYSEDRARMLGTWSSERYGSAHP